MRVLAIDPGNEQSAYCVLEDYKPVAFGKVPNVELLERIRRGVLFGGLNAAVIEMVASYGMAVGKEVFETCVWIGRFIQALDDFRAIRAQRIFRIEEKLALCHDSRAKDSNIRQALIDRFAKHDMKTGKGTKKNPDWFYGFAADVWQSYAVGVTWLDLQYGKEVSGE